MSNANANADAKAQAAKGADPDKPVVEVQDFPAGWHCVTCEEWSVTVGPDGNIRLPQLVRLDDIDSFVTAIKAAKPVAQKQVAANKAAAKHLSNNDRVQRMEALQRNMIRRDAMRHPQPPQVDPPLESDTADAADKP